MHQTSSNYLEKLNLYTWNWSLDHDTDISIDTAWYCMKRRHPLTDIQQLKYIHLTQPNLWIVKKWQLMIRKQLRRLRQPWRWENIEGVGFTGSRVVFNVNSQGWHIMGSKQAPGIALSSEELQEHKVLRWQLMKPKTWHHTVQIFIYI